MSWTRTYTHTLAVAVDILTASVFWNGFDVTVSSLCGLALRRSPNGSSFLCRLGRALNWLSAGHCEAAIAADEARATDALTLLTENGNAHVSPGATGK